MKYTLLLNLCLIFASLLAAQDTTSPRPFIEKGIDVWRIHSTTIGEDFTVYALKPPGYDTSKQTVGVLYMTDGDWNMTVAMNCFNMLRQDYDTHEPLIVGIGYGTGENKRVRDLDPENGGPKFLEFIEKEVMPFVAKKYRTNDERAIYGYSMGGMFATYVLFTRPELFDKVLIGAPGNNGRLLMPAARAYKGSDLKNEVFVGVGAFERETTANVDSFTTYMKQKKYPGLKIRSKITPEGGHGAALAQVMQYALFYSYCVHHTPVAANPATYSRYTGNYVYYENGKAVEEVNIFTKNNKLYFTWNNSRVEPEELLASENNTFFTPAAERHTFRFTKVNNKYALIIQVANDKEYVWEKK